jgi:hypothetical protein
MEPLDGGQKTVSSVQQPNEEEVFDNLCKTPQNKPYRATLVVLAYDEAGGVHSSAMVKELPVLRREEPIMKKLGE